MDKHLANKPVSREDVDEMKRFRQIMEGGFSSDPWSRIGSKPNNETQSSSTKAVVNTPNGPDADMVNFVKLMEGLYDGNAVEKLVEASASNPEIAEALETTPTDNGIKVGKWQIRVRTDESRGKNKKYFDVAHSVSKQIIAKNLCIYEAALALVRYLNNGKPITGPEIKTLLEKERNYHSHLIDALTHKVNSLKAEKRGDYNRSTILEARFIEAKSKLLILEKEIQKLSKTAL